MLNNKCDAEHFLKLFSCPVPFIYERAKVNVMILLKSLDTAKHLITFVKNNAIVNALKVRNNAGCDLVHTVIIRIFVAVFPS